VTDDVTWPQKVKVAAGIARHAMVQIHRSTEPVSSTFSDQISAVLFSHTLQPRCICPYSDSKTASITATFTVLSKFDNHYCNYTIRPSYNILKFYTSTVDFADKSLLFSDLFTGLRSIHELNIKFCPIVIASHPHLYDDLSLKLCQHSFVVAFFSLVLFNWFLFKCARQVRVLVSNFF